MQSFVDKIKSFFNVRTKGMRLVLFNVMVVVAVLGGVFSIIMAIASLLPGTAGADLYCGNSDRCPSFLSGKL